MASPRIPLRLEPALPKKQPLRPFRAQWHGIRSSVPWIHSEPSVVDAADARLCQLVQAIEAYLAAHPDAADSEQGITDWWLSSVGVYAASGELGPALAKLVARGKIEAHQLPDGRVIYRAPGAQGRRKAP
jgi:hypothetical protein